MPSGKGRLAPGTSHAPGTRLDLEVIFGFGRESRVSATVCRPLQPVARLIAGFRVDATMDSIAGG